ncbi:MAG: CotH kinase family protein [Lachnospiraceae bacterium]|nr:CotH kinase family protein [Lachnospiraceae bacterium]
MKQLRIRILTIVVISAAILGALLYMDRKAQAMREKATLQMSAEELDTLAGVRFFLPADENRGLPCDLQATLFDENELEQYLIVPMDLDASHLVCYAKDAFGNYLNRYEIDFSATDTYAVGFRNLILRRTHLPVLSITLDERSPSLADLVASDKSVQCYGNLTLSVDRDLAHDRHWIDEIHSRDASKNVLGSVTLRGRGNTSWDFCDKKSFSIDFEKANYLLGLGKNRKWNLIGNAMDKTLLNNEVFLQMSSDLGVAYEPHCEQVTLYIDGEYQGVYLLTTKVNVDRDRIALREGDFLLNWGGTDEEQPLYYSCPAWENAKGDYRAMFADLVWPKEDTEQGKADKQALLQEFIDVVTDPSDERFTEIIDLDSLVAYYWAQEISMNYDADFRSTYFYYKADAGKFYMGPVWDLDLSLGWIADKFGAFFDEPQGWKLRRMSWYEGLFEREEFRDAVRDAYLNGGVREAMFSALERFEKRIGEMEEDGDLDYRRWRADWPDLGIRYGDSYEAQAAGRLQFFADRVAWIDAQMMQEE